MNIKELKTELDKYNVLDDEYLLPGEEPRVSTSEIFVYLVKSVNVVNGYDILVLERNTLVSHETFDTEDAACLEMLRIFLGNDFASQYAAREAEKLRNAQPAIKTPEVADVITIKQNDQKPRSRAGISR